MISGCLCVSAYALETVTSGGITYSPSAMANPDGTTTQCYKITKCTAGTGTIDIAESIGEVPVSVIGKEAFKGNSAAAEIIVPENIIRIEDNAFEDCTNLKNAAILGESCKIGKALFRNCISLETAVLPEGITSVPQDTFLQCKALEDVSIPSGTETIGKDSFSGCLSLTQITIPASVTYISQNAFTGCSGMIAYNVESGNTAYCSVDGAIYDIGMKKLIQYPSGDGKDTVTIPAGAETIGEYAAGVNDTCKKVILPESLKTISDYGFYECSSLSDIVLPASLEAIGSMAFAECSSLKEITIPASAKVFDGAFYKSGLRRVILENGLDYIDTKAFEKCRDLTEVIIPEGVTEIRMGAFYDCSSLSSVTIPASVKTIGTNAFAGCGNITLSVVPGSAGEKYAKDNGIPFNTYGEKTVTGISVASMPAKVKYNYKSDLDTSGLSLKVTYGDGSSQTVTSGYTVSPTHFDSTGTKTVNVEYGGCSCSFSVTVSYAWWQMLIRILLLGFLWY